MPTPSLPSIFIKYLLLGTFVVSAVFAETDLKREIATIAAIPDGGQRLAAFDELAAKLQLGPNSQKQSDSSGKWNIQIATSPVDDSRVVTASVKSDNPIQGQFGTTKQPYLILRYKEGQIDAYITFDVYLGRDSTPATVRFGKEPAEETSFSISTDHTAAFISGDISAFMARLAKVDTFLVRIVPYNANPVIATFSTTGVDKVIAAIQAASPKKAPEAQK